MYMSLNDSRVSMTSTALLGAAAGANGVTMRGATAPPGRHLRSLTRRDDRRRDAVLPPAVPQRRPELGRTLSRGPWVGSQPAGGVRDLGALVRRSQSRSGRR